MAKIMALIPCLMLPNNREVNHKSLVQNYEQLKLDEYAIYVGIPAKKIGERSKDLRYEFTGGHTLFY